MAVFLSDVAPDFIALQAFAFEVSHLGIHKGCAALSDPHAPKSLFPPYTYTYPLPPSPPPPQAADTLKQQLEDLMKDRADLFDTMIESESKIRLDESGWKARCVAKCGECGEEWGSNICLSNYSMKQGGGDGEWGYSWSS